MKKKDVDVDDYEIDEYVLMKPKNIKKVMVVPIGEYKDMEKSQKKLKSIKKWAQGYASYFKCECGREHRITWTQKLIKMVGDIK